MNSFQRAKLIEEKGMIDLVHILQKCKWCEGGRCVTTIGAGFLTKYLQENCGDILYNDSSGRLWSIEAKIEQDDKYGNLFLEQWSNKSTGRQGWMHTINADILWYYFLGTKHLLHIDVNDLLDWAFRSDRIESFPSKAQQKYRQHNDAYGYCVPIKVIKEEVGCGEYKNGKWAWHGRP